MADLRDEFGNPIQITDEHGNPVRLTDEYGNPIHITGVATSQPLEALKAEGGSGEHDKGRDEGEVREEKEGKDESPGEIQRSSSSSSSSSEEDDGQGGRRKKKGLKQKIKEKLTGGKHKEERMEEQGHITENVTGATKADEEQKKGVMEKIKDMLPGHHSH